MGSVTKFPGKSKGKGNAKTTVAVAALQKENVESVGGLPPRTLSDWNEMPPRMRDRIAAEAYIAENGFRPAAALRLGFRIDPDDSKNSLLYRKLFATEGFREIVAREEQDAESNREPLIERLVRIGLNGDAQESIRATQLLARLVHWKLDPESVTNIDARRLTLLQLMGATPNATAEPQPGKNALPAPSTEATFLDHEPGEPVRVSSDDNIDAMLDRAQ